MIFDNLKIVFLWIMRAVKFMTIYWVYALWPLLYCAATISDKYWGNDNWFEQVIEAVNKLQTGENVDISKGSGEEPNDLKKYIP